MRYENASPGNSSMAENKKPVEGKREVCSEFPELAF